MLLYEHSCSRAGIETRYELGGVGAVLPARLHGQFQKPNMKSTFFWCCFASKATPAILETTCDVDVFGGSCFANEAGWSELNAWHEIVLSGLLCVQINVTNCNNMYDVEI